MQKRWKPARVIAGSFLTVIIIGTFLLFLPAAWQDDGRLSLLDALFTATSATCVTGLSVITVGTELSLFGQAVLLGLIQIGGLGLMTMTTMIFLVLGGRLSVSHRLTMKESLNLRGYADIRALTRNIVVYTVSLEGIGTLLLALRFWPEMGFGQGLWYGLFHAVSAFNNAGFDLFGNSLMGYSGDWFVLTVIIILIVLGGLGFAVIAECGGIIRGGYGLRGFKRLNLHAKVVLMMTGLLIVSGAVLIFMMEFFNPATLGPLPLHEKALAALFQSVTCRTAGFNSIDLSQLNRSSMLVMMCLMMIGASPTSTGGGLKTTTVGIILLTVYAVIRGRDDLVVFKRRISVEQISKALAVIVIGISVVLLGIMLLSTLEGEQQVVALEFEAISAFSTTGVSLGITASLGAASKVVIILLMFIGRIGPLTLALALTRRQNDSRLNYPEGHIMIG